MKRIISLIISLLAVYSTNAQIILKGNISTSTGEPVSFINVALYSTTDTTKLISGSITDKTGSYVMQSIRPGRYHLIISGIGYTTVKEGINLRMPSAGNIATRDFTTDESTTVLDEVVVKATRKNSYADKSVHTFSKEQIKNARYSNDLLVGVGDLSTDMITNKISKPGGGSVKILINGINATDNDLKSIPADKVLKVEYYDIPPARYATVSTLVNIITKRLDTGWNGGLDASHAFTTGFGNDNLFLKYVTGNHQLSFDYELHYRNYKDRFIIENYQYRLENKNMDYLYQSHDKFGYTDNFINLKYACSKPEKYTLQATFSPNFNTQFSKTNSKILLSADETLQERSGYNNNNINSFGPTADIYFSKKMKHNQELALNVVGTYYHNNQEKMNRETAVADNSPSLIDEMSLHNNKKSLISEITYNKTWGISSLNIGYKSTLASSQSTISNYFSEGKSYEYNSHNNHHYLYTEYGNNKNKFMYRIGIGGTWTDAHNDDTKYSRFLFTPKIILAYKFRPEQNIQWLLTTSPSIPTISQLSNNVELITNGLLHRGNPYLRSGNSYITTLRYNWNTDWIDLNLSAVASYSEDPISIFYKEETINRNNYIVSSAENAKSFLLYGGLYSLSIRPFKNDQLLLKFYGMAFNQELNSPIIGKYTQWYTPLFYSVSFRKGDWGASYNGNIVSKQLDGAYMKQDENQSNLQVFYQHKNLRLIAGCYWLFSKSRYHNETLPNDILRHDTQSYINDNRTMLTIGFSWNFSAGKTFNVKRKLQNKDTDKGTF